MDNLVGKRLDGRYELQEIIGVGGMAVVYKAYDNIEDRIVAVKILKEEFGKNEDFLRRFQNRNRTQRWKEWSFLWRKCRNYCCRKRQVLSLP